MDREDAMTEAALPFAQQRSEIYDRKFLENFVANLSKCLNYWFIGKLSGKDFQCSRELGGSTPERGHIEENLRKIF